MAFWMYSVARESVAEHVKFKKFETRVFAEQREENFLIIKNDENKKAKLCVLPPSTWVLLRRISHKFIKNFLPFLGKLEENEAAFQFSFEILNSPNWKQSKGKSDLIITYNFPNVPDPVTSWIIIDGGNLIKRHFSGFYVRCN